MIVLIVEPQRKNLVVCEIGVELRDDRILSHRSGGIKAKAACIQAIAGRRVISAIAPCGGGEHSNCGGVRAWIDAIRGNISSADLCPRQTKNSRRCAGRTSGVARTIGRAIANDTLAECGQRHFSNYRRTGSLPEALVIDK